jgi:hypothetical protein
MDTVSSGTAGVHSSQDTTNNSVIRNSDHHTNEKNSNLRMRPCSVQLHDILGTLKVIARPKSQSRVRLTKTEEGGEP